MKKVTLIIIGIVLLILAGVGSMVAVFVKALAEPITDEERALIVVAAELVPYYDDFNPSENDEEIMRMELFGRLLELTYEYDSERDDEPYINNSIGEKGSSISARKDVLIQWNAMVLIMKAYGFETQENNDFYSVGDSSRFGDFVTEGSTVGHMLVVRKGNFVYSYVISGFIMTDPELWHELFDHRIEAL